MSADKVLLRGDLPEIYQKAGNAAAKSQDMFLAWSLVNFAVLTLAAVVSTLKSWLHTAAAVSGAVMLASGAIMTFWLRKSRYEIRWYSSRAVAESIKTLSWRYMMRAAPFEGGSPEADAEAATLFEKFVHDIADQEAAPAPEPHEIAAKMKEVRHRAAAEIADLYMKERIEDQRTWYARNCEKNSRNGNRMLWFAIATQVIACGLALIQIAHEIPDFVGVFATVSAGALAWM